MGTPARMSSVDPIPVPEPAAKADTSALPVNGKRVGEKRKADDTQTVSQFSISLLYIE